MTKTYRNEGLIQTGGKIQADQIAVGHKAQAIRYSKQAIQRLEETGLTEVRANLTYLIQILEEHTASLPNRDEILSSAETVTKELSKEKPNKLTVTSVLEGIARNVNSVTAIASAVEALKSAITTFM